jgi:hypothetical protein
MLSTALGAVAPVYSERLRREETLRLARGPSSFIPESRGDRRLSWRLSFVERRRGTRTRESPSNAGNWTMR